MSYPGPIQGSSTRSIKLPSTRAAYAPYSPEQREWLFDARRRGLSALSAARVFSRTFDRRISDNSVYKFWQKHPLPPTE